MISPQRLALLVPAVVLATAPALTDAEPAPTLNELNSVERIE